jgi:NADH-quinone oxidoreductase subunit M
MGGIGMRAPVLATMFLIVAFATLAMPGSSNFVGEFYILLGVFTEKIVIAIVATAGVVLASVYALRLYIGAVHNRTGPRVESREISLREGLVLVPLVLLILAIALYPQFALQRSEKSVTSLTAPPAGATAELLSGGTPYAPLERDDRLGVAEPIIESVPAP